MFNGYERCSSNVSAQRKLFTNIRSMRKVIAKAKVAERDRIKILFTRLGNGRVQLTERDTSLAPKTQFSYIHVKIKTETNKVYTVKLLITINSCVEAISSVVGPGIDWSNKSTPELKKNLWDEISNKAKDIVNKFIKCQVYGSWEIETEYRIKIDGSYEYANLYKGPITNGFGKTLDPKRIFNKPNKFNHLGNAKDAMNKIHEYLFFLNKQTK